MAEVTVFNTDAMKEYFPNVSIDAYRYVGPPLDLNRIVLFVAYSTLFFVGTISNIYVGGVLASILRLKSAETPRAIRVYVFALCCCDLWVLAFIPFLLFDLVYNQWVVASSSLLCQLYLCSESVNKFCGPFLLVALSAFCYSKICRPPGAQSFGESSSNDDGSRKFFSRQLIGRGLGAPVVVVLVCAMLAFALVTPVYVYGDLYYLVVHNGTDVRLIMAKCAFHPPETVMTAFTIYCFICGYVIPAGSFTVFYAAVVLRVKRQTPAVFGLRATPPTLGAPTTESLTYQQVDHHGRSRRLERATRTCVGLIFFYLFCWTPYWMMNLYRYFYAPDDDDEGSSYVPKDVDVVAGYLVHLLPYINCAGYPILHAILNRNIRRDCGRLKAKRTRQRGVQMAMDSERRSNCHTAPLCSTNRG